MKFGIQHPNFSFDGQGPEMIDSLRALVQRAEALGYDSFWVMDHLHQIHYVGKPAEPMLEGWTTISVLAGMTSKLRLGTLVTGNAYRYPSLLAKIASTLDVLSKGRLFMGIGAAWNEEEAQAYGIPFPPTRERLERLDEAVQIIRKLWTEESTTFHGKYYHVENALCNPKPVQKPHPQILIGGMGEKYLLRTVAKYGDACNLFGSPATVKKKLVVLKEHCRAVGRDYDAILKTKLTQAYIDADPSAVRARVSQLEKMMPPGMLNEAMIYGTPEQIQEQVEAFREAGVEYLIMSFNPGSELAALTLFGEEVLPHFWLRT